MHPFRNAFIWLVFSEFMRKGLISIVFLFSLASPNFSSANSSVSDSSNVKLEEIVQAEPFLASVQVLNNLVGGPDDGDVLTKLNNLFYCDGDSINLKVERQTLIDYFSQSNSSDVLETSHAILENFNYVIINTGVGGGLEVNFYDRAQFPVHTKKMTLEVETSQHYKSITIDKFVFEGRDSSLVSYVSRFEEGSYSRLSGGNIVKNSWLGFLNLMGVDKADLPEFHKARWLLSLGKRYFALFRENGEEVEQVGRIFDIESNKYDVEDLEDFYKDAYDRGRESIKRDKFK